MPPPELAEVVAEALGVTEALGAVDALGAVEVLGLTEAEALGAVEALGVVDAEGATDALGVTEALVSPVSVHAANTKQLTERIAATITAANALNLLILFLLIKLDFLHFIINNIKIAIYRINRTIYRINCSFCRFKRCMPRTRISSSAII